MTKRLIRFAIISTFLSLALTLTVSALYYPTTFYTNRSWTYQYAGTYTSSYNCLGYATGSMRWEWPWGASNPTSANVTTYLSNTYGLTSFSWGTPYQPKIISYGTSSGITHFSKVPTGASGYCYAKWGQLELFKHNSLNPYNVGYDSWGSYYGSLVLLYK